MAILYILGAAAIMVLHLPGLPRALAEIFTGAFSGTAATGGFLGSGFILAMQMGVRRGLFSNESGLGSAPIAHATAKTPYPVREGHVALLEPFIDTIVICSMTGLVIILTGAWTTGLKINGAELSSFAFAAGFGKLGPEAAQFLGRATVAAGVILFAYSTAISWSYYGDRCASYLFGLKAVTPYRVVFCLFLITGATIKIDLVWNLCDIMNGCMAIPNLIALILLSGAVLRDLNDYRVRIPEFDREIAGRRAAGRPQ
jgi:AGCS family alanine or glycine:cation symporter